MNNILLDTHVLVWLLVGSNRIGRKSTAMISNALREEKLYFASISMWEVAMLVEKGRIKLMQPIHHWYRDVLSLGIKEVALQGDIAFESVLLGGFHADPADRIIAATAIGKGCALVTGDQKILRWQGMLKRHNAEE